jgi:hypothetical protein
VTGGMASDVCLEAKFAPEGHFRFLKLSAG